MTEATQCIKDYICKVRDRDRQSKVRQQSIVHKFITYYMADPLHLYYKPDLASNLLHIEDSQQISVKYNLLV